MANPAVKTAPHLEDLNPPQLEAVTHGDGPLLIFAGAGSGKTRVLTRRIAHLILEHGVGAANILAVTFTNKAAREMKHRVESIFSGASLPFWIGTFHSTCVRILRLHAEKLDYTPQFVIYDSSDSMSAMKRVYKRLNIDPKAFEPRTILSAIDRAKNNFESPEDVRKKSLMGREFVQLVAELYTEYQRELRSANAMDFGDLLMNVVTLFKLEPAILEQYQDRFKYVLVDEYQDTNRVQYMFVKLLTDKHRNLTVVGDDDQSIYKFRGATVETILNFRKDYPDAKVVTLSTNYRSTKSILQAANAVIAKNKRREPKSMNTPNGHGSPILGYNGFDERDEAEYVAREIASMMRREIPLSDVALFYRTNAQSRAFEEVFQEMGIPYVIFGGQRFYDRKEIKDVVAYLRLLINTRDDEALLRIINTPARGIGGTTVVAVQNEAQKQRTYLFDLCQQIARGEQKQLGKAVNDKITRFVELIEGLKEQADRAQKILTGEEAADVSVRPLAIANLLRLIADRSGYIKALQKEDTQEAESRIENITELFRVAADFGLRANQENEIVTLHDFLDRASLASDLDKDEKGDKDSSQQEEAKAEEQRDLGSVSMMTLHLAKGLEYDNVFLVGLEEGILPHVRSLNDGEDLEEERRLCYVGITRARKQLYISRVSDRNTYGRGSNFSGAPSRFIYDLPREIIDDRGSGFFPDRRTAPQPQGWFRRS